LKKEIKILENNIEELIKENNMQMYSNIRSIPGVGKKTALLLIASTNGFKSFDSHRQLSAFFGLAPTERTSGTSIKGRSRISKAGNPKIRNYLFLCSFTASQCNPQCNALYERLVAKGKSKKLALIAVTNKLLKQAFSIAKSGICYDKNYRSVLIN
jgi:transposase